MTVETVTVTNLEGGQRETPDTDGHGRGDWLATQNSSVVVAAQGGGDRYGLWIELVRLQLRTLSAADVDVDPSNGDWRDRYRTGWSPRQAAFAAWAYTGLTPAMASSLLPDPVRPQTQPAPQSA